MRAALILIVILFEIKFFLCIPENLSNKIIIFVALYQLIFLLSLILIWKKKLEIFANFLLLLLFANLFTQGWIGKFQTYRTLQPFINEKVLILGETMPGFEGVNNITTDEKGFRVTKEIDYENQKSFRIFAIGASTTEESYVDDHETWTARLENHVKPHFQEPVEVINTGVSGLRVKNHLATLLETEKFYPDLYIFLIGVNDWNHHIKKVLGFKKNTSITKTIIYEFLRSNQKYLNLISPVSSIKNDKIKKEYGEYYSSQNDSLSRKIVKKIKVVNVDREYLKFINNISQNCKSKKYRCMFVTQPSAYSKNISQKLKKRLWMTPPNVEYTLDLESLIQISGFYNNWLFKFSKKNKIPVCDLAKEIEPSESFFYDDVHFNENGSSYVAKIIYNCLKKNHIIN